MVGAPVWPNGVTLAAQAAFTVTAVAASAAAPVSILRRSRPPPLPCLEKVSGVVMISSHVFCWEKIHVPAIRHKAGGQAGDNPLNRVPIENIRRAVELV